MKKLNIFILFFLIGCEVFATDRLYLQCDPEENCVVGRIGNVTIENPACVAKRALCRIKCRNLNDDADRYIREDKNKIAIIDEELKFNQIQLDRQNENIRIQVLEFEKFNLQVKEVNQFIGLQNEQINRVIQLIDSIKAKALEDSQTLDDLTKKELSNDEKSVLVFIKSIYGEDHLALQQFVAQDSQSILFQLQNQILDAFVQAKLSLNQLQITVTNTQESIKQIMQKMKELSEQRKKLVDHIKEQVERKCPANLV